MEVINKAQYMRETERATNVILYYVNKMTSSFMSLLHLESYLVQGDKLYYSKEHYKIHIDIIKSNTTHIQGHMLKLREFCYTDIKRVIPLIESLDDRSEEEGVSFIKNLTLLGQLLDGESGRLTEEQKVVIREGMEANKRIREFFHQASSIISLIFPHKATAMVERQELQKMPTVNDIVENITKCYGNLERFRREVILVRYLSDVINEESCFITTMNVLDIADFVEFYRNRGRDYFYASVPCNIEVYYDAKSPAHVLTDSGKIREVIEVILNNAFEELALLSIEEEKERENQILGGFFTKKRTNIVEITSDWIDCRTKSGIKLVIKDNGRGIGDLDKAYQPFSTTKADFGGTGLGLNIAKRICDFLGIKVLVESNKKGTTFTLSINDCRKGNLDRLKEVCKLGENLQI